MRLLNKPDSSCAVVCLRAGSPPQGRDCPCLLCSGTSSHAHVSSRVSAPSPLDLAPVDLPEPAEGALELQLQQLSLPQLCAALLEAAAPLLRTGRWALEPELLCTLCVCFCFLGLSFSSFSPSVLQSLKICIYLVSSHY